MTHNDLMTLAQRLREYNHNPHHINPMSEAFHKLITDAAEALAALAAELAAIRAAGGEEVEVVGYGFQHVDHGWIFRNKHTYEANPHLEAFSLMTVTQHQRIVAAMAAELERAREALEIYGAVYSEHWKPGMPILEPISDAALIAQAATGANSHD